MVRASLYVCQSGWQLSGKGHYYGPIVRDFFVIHYIIKGKGKYNVNGKTYYLEKNNGFLIMPGDSTFYQADEDDPWEYYWVGFDGTESKRLIRLAGFDKDNLIFEYKRDGKLGEYIENMYEASQKNAYPDIEMIGYLYLFMSCLINQNLPSGNIQNEYLKKAINYIENNYYKKLSVSMLSSFVGVERTHLYRIFKAETNQSINSYIRNFRISKAKDSLLFSDYSIEEIAALTGFSDTASFSKAFKNVVEISPTKYRKMIREKINAGIFSE